MQDKRGSAKSATYVIGDIHGRADLLGRLIDRIMSDAKRKGVSRPRIVGLGDYCDRGPDTAKVIDMLAALGNKADFSALKGNHDDMLLEFLDGASNTLGIQWWKNGGDAVFASYGIPMDENTFMFNQPQARLALLAAMPASHKAFLKGLKTFIDDGENLFVHAGVDPRKPLSQQTEEDLLWVRNVFLNSDKDFGRFVVHGHTIAANGPELRRNRLGVDTGSAHNGVLTCVRIDGDGRYKALAASNEGLSKRKNKGMVFVDVGENNPEPLWANWCAALAEDAGLTYAVAFAADPEPLVAAFAGRGIILDVRPPCHLKALSVEGDALRDAILKSGWQVRAAGSRSNEAMLRVMRNDSHPGCSQEVRHEDGSFVRYDAEGKVHCDGAPAVRDSRGNEFWFTHGKKGVASGPAVERQKTSGMRI